MEILLFLSIGFIAGYIVKDLLTKESEVIYHIKRLKAKKGGEIKVESEVTISKHKDKQPKEKKQRKRFLRKNK